MKYLIEGIANYTFENQKPLYNTCVLNADDMAEAMHMINVVNTINRQYGNIVRCKIKGVIERRKLDYMPYDKNGKHATGWEYYDPYLEMWLEEYEEVK